ncbi:MAG: cupin domain-containing protein [Chloroflexota bacterium]
MSAQGYTPSPRPTFAGPAHIPYAAATRHLWGDAESGEVADWIYVSSEKIHQLVFGLPPGGAFRHSEAYRTIFGADELLRVLGGEMVIANPESGEVHRVRAGESVVFGPDTWHHAFSYGTEPLRVLELFAPPPSQGTSGAYARAKPYLHTSRYTQDQWLGRWPAAREEARRADSIHVVRDDILWRLEGREHQVLVGLLLATTQLTAGIVRLLPGRQSEVRTHGGDLSLYTPAGGLHVRLPEHEGQRWFELQAGDGFYIPEGVSYQYYNVMDRPVEALFGVAPHYLPE